MGGADLCGGAIHRRLGDGFDGDRLHGFVGNGEFFVVASGANWEIVSFDIGGVGGVLVVGVGLVCAAWCEHECAGGDCVAKTLVCFMVV